MFFVVFYDFMNKVIELAVNRMSVCLVMTFSANFPCIRIFLEVVKMRRPLVIF